MIAKLKSVNKAQVRAQYDLFCEEVAFGRPATGFKTDFLRSALDSLSGAAVLRVYRRYRTGSSTVSCLFDFRSQSCLRRGARNAIERSQFGSVP